jgi:hypothetical protein
MWIVTSSLWIGVKRPTLWESETEIDFFLIDHTYPPKWQRTLPRTLLLLGHLYLSGMSFGVDPIIYINKTCVKRRLDCYSTYDYHSTFNNEHNGIGEGTYMTIKWKWESSLSHWIRYPYDIHKLWGKRVWPWILDLDYMIFLVYFILLFFFKNDVSEYMNISP